MTAPTDRTGCCDDQRKPCSYHEGALDAADAAALPDPRPTEAEAVPHVDTLTEWEWDRLRDLGCFRPEPANG